MPAVPEFWREAVYHPLVVHFPVALLSVGAACELIRTWCSRSRLTTYAGNTAIVSVCLGTIGAWAAIYTGEMAEGVVNKVICDPTATAAHEQIAWNVAYIFSMLSAVLIFREVRGSKPPSKSGALARSAWSILLILGLVGILQTGHSGAELVYQQGAAVYRPSESCEEFE